MPISEILKQAKERLTPASDAPHLDAERLLLFVLGQRESSWLVAHSDQELTQEQEKKFEKLVNERATGKPLAYILGEWEFYGRKFFITPDVLVPRPETENLIDAALPYIDVWREKHLGETMTIADIGTGSGVIAVTLALEFTSPARKAGDLSLLRRGASPYEGEAGRNRTDEVNFLALDISPAALKVAEKNAERHGVEKQIEFMQGDMLIPIKERNIDLIVSNPPYLPAEALAKAGRTTDTLGLTFEPRLALDGGPDGQDFIRQIQATKIPAIVESTGGVILKFNC